jgi:simple sugar transport system permease protein
VREFLVRIVSALVPDREEGGAGRGFLSRALTFSAPVLGAVVGLVIGGLLMLIADANPIVAYKTMFEGAFGGQRQIVETLLKAHPLLVIGLGLGAAFRARVWNIGGEGQYYIGALLGGVVALYLPHWPRPLLLTTMLLAGVVGGAIWAALAAGLKVEFGMSEIISTLMLNYIAVLFVTYLARGPLQEPGGYLPVSAPIDQAARLPRLFGTRLHAALPVAVLLVPVIYYLLWHTPLGFRLRAVGSRASVAEYAGISVERSVVTALLLSGGLAGLAGIVEISTLHYRLKAGISGGYGFSAILVALLGRMNPFGVAVSAILFAALVVGAETMHVVAGLPPQLAQAIQAVIVLSVLAVDALAHRRVSA